MNSEESIQPPVRNLQTFRVEESSIQPPVRNLQTLITVRLYQLFLF